VLFLMADQMQGRVFRRGHPCRTPNIDRLMESGTAIRNAYTPNAVCSPARASLMTGLLPHNHGVLQVIHTTDDDQNVLRTDKPHWAQRLQQAGYLTGYFGKWHVERSERLEAFGWEINGCAGSELYRRKLAQLNAGNRKDGGYRIAKYNEEPGGYRKTLLYGVTDVPPERREVGVVTELAADFLDLALRQNRPWCCFVSVKEPHDPFVCGEEAYGLYDPESLELPANVHDDLEGRPYVYKKAARVWAKMTDRERKEAMACYYGSITEIDAQFGRLLQKLRDAGQLENTIVVVTSDHGELLGAHGLYTKNISACEEVYHIPMILAGPGISVNRSINARVGLHDLGPTLLELTECEPINAPDSRSFAPLLRDPSLEREFQTGFAEYHGGRVLLTQRIVWNGPWKLVFNGFDRDELYHLDDDPFEMNNRIDDPHCAEKLRDMCRQMWKTIRATGDHSLLKSDYPSLRLAPYGPNI